VGSHLLRGRVINSREWAVMCWGVSIFLLFLRFCYWILEPFWSSFICLCFFVFFFLHFIDNLVVFKKKLSFDYLYISATPFEKILSTFNIDNFTAIRWHMQILNRSNYVMMKTIEITETITLYLIKTSKMVSFTKKLRPATGQIFVMIGSHCICTKVIVVNFRPINQSNCPLRYATQTF
jgi:hypothetical protein